MLRILIILCMLTALFTACSGTCTPAKGTYLIKRVHGIALERICLDTLYDVGDHIELSTGLYIIERRAK